jgi:hypothetical protein
MISGSIGAATATLKHDAVGRVLHENVCPQGRDSTRDSTLSGNLII